MSHEISKSNGVTEMFSGRGKLPWWQGMDGLTATVVKGLVTWREALELAHLNWKVKGYPVTVNGRTLDFPTEDTSENCWQGVCREDTGECLGIMRGRYEPIQNADAFSFFDCLVANGEAAYDTAGALRGGRQVWALAKVDGTEKINGEEHDKYALMVTSHDGSYSLMVQFVLVRVVCANTLSIALAGAKSQCKIRHTDGWRNKEEEARRILGVGNKYFATIQEAVKNLTSRLLSPAEMEIFTAAMFPVKEGEEVSTRTANIRAEVNRLFSQGDGNHGATRYDAFNAVSDYTDHVSTLRGAGSTRLESALMGTGAQLKQKAFEYLSSDELMADLLNRAHKPAATSVQAGAELARLLAK